MNARTDLTEIGSMVMGGELRTLDRCTCPECGWPVILITGGTDPAKWILADAVVIGALSKGWPYAHRHECERNITPRPEAPDSGLRPAHPRPVVEIDPPRPPDAGSR